MNLAVFRHALRQAARPTLILALAAGAFCYLVLLSSSSFLGAGEQVPEFLRHPPKAVGAFLGGSADLLSPAGWLASALLHPVMLSLQTAAALVVSAGAVATELERGTLELVITRPVGRIPFLTGKMGAALVTVTVVQAAALGGAFIARLTVENIDQIPVDRMLLTFAGAWSLFALIAMIAVAFSARGSLRSRAVGAAVGIVVAAFFLNFLALLFDSIQDFRYASPFHYFRPADILSGKDLAWDMVGLVGVAVLFGLLGLRVFARRDLTR